MADQAIQAPAGYTLDATVKPPAGYSLDSSSTGDPAQQALNYRTGNNLVDAPMGVLQGAAKGVASTGYGLVDLANKVVPNPVQLDQAYRDSITKPNGIGQGTGKFLEQAAEFAIPSAAAGKLVKGAPLLARAATQALVGGGVSAAQSGGDPVATGVGTVLGAGGELVPAAYQAAKGAASNKAPTLENFADSFFATPKQKEVISDALATLQKDGVKPGDDIHQMQDAVKGKISDLQDAYKSLDPAIKQRVVDPNDVINKLKDAQQQYMRRGVVTDDGAYNAIQKQIQTVKEIAAANNGNLDIDDLVHLKQKANGKTNFASPQAEQDTWQAVGNAYRKVADATAPETTPLNQDYQKYKSLESVIDQNVDRGKGTTQTGLDRLLHKATSAGVGATVGAGITHTLGLGAELGAIAGAAAGPVLAKPAVQALRNLSDSGIIDQLGAPAKYMLQKAVAAGDNEAIVRIAGGITKEMARRTATANQPASAQ